MTSTALQNGNALLLIDGLDEISEDKNRISFVNQLRTFIATYPAINIIVTSREAGFRVVAGSLATYCQQYSVSNLDDLDIRNLSLKWHKAIIDDSENTIKEANKLTELILKDNRIKVLGENPLLLTTLLFVKRWAGYLPTKRSILYQEMIKLLLVTWNVEGHEILEIEETEPQLAYVAYWMTKNGQQTISAEELNSCLIEARRLMPEILGYTKVSPSEFIKRVELRSSLLIMAGHKRVDTGHLTAVYEFLHLSFQEYLTAKAIVKKFIPQTDIENKVVDIIKPNINNESWKEVIPLTAVLLERETKDLVDYLISESKMVAVDRKNTKQDSLAPLLLGNCLANEIQIGPDLLDSAMEWYAKNTYVVRDKSITEIILNNKFGDAFRKRIRDCFFAKYDDKYASPLGSILSDIFIIDLRSIEKNVSPPNEILSILKKDIKSKEEKCIAILGMMGYAFSIAHPNEARATADKTSDEVFLTMLDLLKTNDLHYQFSISWCIAWSGQVELFPEKLRLMYLSRLLKLWIKSSDYYLKRVIAWALFKIITPDVPKDTISKIPKIKENILENYQKPVNENDKMVAIYLGGIMGIKFDSNELSDFFNQRNEGSWSNKNFFDFAKILGIKLKEKDEVKL